MIAGGRPVIQVGVNCAYGNGVANSAIEIDSYPDRQDLNSALIKEAKKAGCLVAIDTDAHSPDQLWFVEYGLAAAAQAKFPAERIVNFMDAATLRKTFQR